MNIYSIVNKEEMNGIKKVWNDIIWIDGGSFYEIWVFFLCINKCRLFWEIIWVILRWFSVLFGKNSFMLWFLF